MSTASVQTVVRALATRTPISREQLNQAIRLAGEVGADPVETIRLAAQAGLLRFHPPVAPNKPAAVSFPVSSYRLLLALDPRIGAWNWRIDPGGRVLLFGRLEDLREQLPYLRQLMLQAYAVDHTLYTGAYNPRHRARYGYDPAAPSAGQPAGDGRRASQHPRPPSPPAPAPTIIYERQGPPPTPTVEMTPSERESYGGPAPDPDSLYPMPNPALPFPDLARPDRVDRSLAGLQPLVLLVISRHELADRAPDSDMLRSVERELDAAARAADEWQKAIDDASS